MFEEEHVENRVPQDRGSNLCTVAKLLAAV